MNDEFFITKTVDTGSEGSKVVKFQLYARNCDGEINEISYEELVRLNQFLTEFLKKEEGNQKFMIYLFCGLARPFIREGR